MENKETLEKIQSLCDETMRHATITNNGGVLINSGLHGSQLLNNGINFHELDKAELFESLIGLSKILSPTETFAFTTDDHYFLWAWCAEVFSNSISTIYKRLTNQQISLLRISAHTALSRTRHESNGIGVHVSSMIGNSSLILQYLTFPLLESILRHVCSDYVEADGTVKKKFGDCKIGRRCNNLGKLLTLYTDLSRDIPERQGTLRLLTEIKSTRPNNELNEWLFQSRSGALHGENNQITTGALVLNICFALCLGELDDETYLSERDSIMQGINWWHRTQNPRPGWLIYPPQI